jgi:hypothetical protein
MLLLLHFACCSSPPAADSRDLRLDAGCQHITLGDPFAALPVGQDGRTTSSGSTMSMQWQCSLLQRQRGHRCSQFGGATRSGHTPRPAGQHCTLREKVRRRNAVGYMAAGTRAPGQCTAAGSACVQLCSRAGSACACVLYYPAACAQQGIILCATACLVPNVYITGLHIMQG